MQPNKKFITIDDNIGKIKALLHELVLQPRLNAIKWSLITKQTPNIKIGYPGQHLASLITGMEGEKTGARGNDLIDGSEVKSCSRIDQLDVCGDCKSPVARLEDVCSNCGSKNIDRKNDSKWLFSVRSEDELDFLLHGVGRVLLVMGDYPDFENGNFETIRFQAFEIWPENPRNKRFSEIMTNYYNKIYLAHKKKNAGKNPAPKNFWPYQYQFYICNPILTFSCLVTKANSNPKIEIQHYLKPSISREKQESVLMPASILNETEINLIFKKASKGEVIKMIKKDHLDKLRRLKKLSLKDKQEMFIGINEELRKVLPLRDTDKISTSKTKYSRRNHLQ
jgi:hypothetical protein